MKESYLSVSGEFENLTIIERSKFICHLRGVCDEEEAKNFIAEIRKKHALATHNCYAFVADSLGNVMKYSDDGEPQGTAGLPMLEVLKNRKIFHTAAVVTRYFGGIKLGAGGLVRTYADSVARALDGASVVLNRLVKAGTLVLSYEQYPKFLQLAEREPIRVERTDFSNEVLLTIAVPIREYESFCARLTEYFLGKVSFSADTERYSVFSEGTWR